MIRRALRTLALVATSVASAMIAFTFAVWLWWLDGPNGNQRSRGVNALWAAHTWVGDPHSDAEYRAFAERMRRYEISDVFFHAGPLDADGTVPAERRRYALQLTAAMALYAPDVRAQAYLGQIEVRGGGILNLDEPAVRDGIVATANTMLDLGFDGIHYDIEPIYPGDENFLEVLERTRVLADRRGAIVSVALEQLEMAPAARSLLRVLSRDYHDPTLDFVEDVAQRVHQVAIMSYDTALPADWLFGAHMAWQTERVVEAIGDRVTVFMGVPTYDDESLKFHSWAENVGTGVRGVRKGLDRVDHDTSRNAGIAIFADWTTSTDEWEVYAEQWLER